MSVTKSSFFASSAGALATTAATAFGSAVVRSALQGTSSSAFEETPDSRLELLKQYTVDLREEARNGRITHPAYERTQETLELACEIYQNQGVCFLRGYSGAGKTALVEGLAYQIEKEGAFSILGSIKILSLQHRTLSSSGGIYGVISEAFRGNKKEKITNLLNALVDSNETDSQHSNKIALFIDEIHEVLEPDTLSRFKDKLARQGFFIIGATTNASYVTRVLAIPDMARRTRQIHLAPLGEGAMVEIITKMRDEILAKEKISLSADVIQALIHFCQDLESQRVFPDKGIFFLKRFYSQLRLSSSDANMVITPTLEDVYSFYEHWGISRQSMIQSLGQQSREQAFSSTFATNFVKTYKNSTSIDPGKLCRELSDTISASPESIPVLVRGGLPSMVRTSVARAFNSSILSISVDKVLRASAHHLETATLLQQALYQNQTPKAFLFEDADLLLADETPSSRASSSLEAPFDAQIISSAADAVINMAPSYAQPIAKSWLQSLKPLTAQTSSSSASSTSGPSVEKNRSFETTMAVFRNFLRNRKVVLTASSIHKSSVEERHWSVIKQSPILPSQIFFRLNRRFKKELFSDIGQQDLLFSLIFLASSLPLKNGKHAWDVCHEICQKIADPDEDLVFLNLELEEFSTEERIISSLKGYTHNVSEDTIKKHLDALTSIRQATFSHNQDLTPWRELFPKMCFKMSELQKGEVLCIHEKDPSKRNFLSQILKRVARSGKGTHVFQFSELREKFPDPIFQTTFLEMITSTTRQEDPKVLITTEAEVAKHCEQMKLLLSQGWSVVCFSDKNRANTEESQGWMEMFAKDGWVQQGLKNAFQSITGWALPNSALPALPKPAASEELLSQAISCESPPFTEKQFLAWFDSLDLQESKKSSFLSMARSLWTRSPDPLPAEKIEKALKAAASLETDDPVKAMHSACLGRFDNLPISEEELRFAVNPTTFPLTYRIQKAAEKALTRTARTAKSLLDQILDWKVLSTAGAGAYLIGLLRTIFRG